VREGGREGSSVPPCPAQDSSRAGSSLPLIRITSMCPHTLHAMTAMTACYDVCFAPPDTSTGQVLDPAALVPASSGGLPQLSTYIELGGARVPFTADEMKACKTLRYPHDSAKEEGEEEEESSRLKVLFFTHAASLGLEMNLDASTFVFPDDTVVKGSVTLFATVANCMVEKGLIGGCLT
jgi:hypothetical protein